MLHFSPSVVNRGRIRLPAFPQRESHTPQLRMESNNRATSRDRMK